MYEDPQDMFREMDTLFSYLVARMAAIFLQEKTRHSATTGSSGMVKNPQKFQIQQRSGKEHTQNLTWRFTVLVMRLTLSLKFPALLLNRSGSVFSIPPSRLKPIVVSSRITQLQRYHLSIRVQCIPRLKTEYL